MSIKTTKSVLRTYLLLALAAGIGLAVCRTVLIKNYYDPYNFTFESGSGSTFRIFEYVVLFAAIVAATSVFFANKTSFQLFSERSSTTSVSICAVCSFLFISHAILLFIYYDAWDIVSNSQNKLVPLFCIASVIAMVFVAFYFMLCASTKVTSKNILSLSLPLFAMLRLMYLYFDTTLMYHDTNRIMEQLAFISILAFFTSEANIATGHAAYGWHFATSLACIICVSAYILPILELVAFWEMSVIDCSSVIVLLYAVFSAFNAIRTMEKAW